MGALDSLFVKPKAAAFVKTSAPMPAKAPIAKSSGALDSLFVAPRAPAPQPVAAPQPPPFPIVPIKVAAPEAQPAAPVVPNPNSVSTPFPGRAPVAYGPQKPAPFVPASSSFMVKPALPSTTTNNATLNLPTQGQQDVVNGGLDSLFKYQESKAPGAGALRTVTGALGDINSKMIAAAGPNFGDTRTKTQKTIDNVRAGLSTLNLFPAWLAFSAATGEAANTEASGASAFNPGVQATGAAAKILNAGMGVIEKGKTDITNYGFDKLVPQTPEFQQWRGVAQDVGSLAAVLAAGHIAHTILKAGGEYKSRTMNTNDVVNSAAKILDIPTKNNVLGQVQRVNTDIINKAYRALAHDLHPDKGGTPEEFGVINKAKSILEDHATLSPKDFRAKYNAPLAGANKVIKQLPSGEKAQPQTMLPEGRPKPVKEPIKPTETPLFHGAEIGDSVSLERIGDQGKGVYLTDSALAATEHSAHAQGMAFDVTNERMPYAAEKANGSVANVTIAPDTKIQSLSFVPVPHDIAAAKFAGFDAVRFPDGKGGNTTLVFDPAKVTRMGLVEAPKPTIEAQTRLPIKLEPKATVPKEKPTYTAPKGQGKLTPRPVTEPDYSPAAAHPIEKIKVNGSDLHSNVLIQLANAEAGKRVAVPNFEPGSPLKYTRQRSTFPQWIPKELRRKPLLEAVTNHITNGTLPTKTAEVRLYKVVADEMRANDAVIHDQAFIERERHNVTNPFASDAENAAAIAKFDEEYAKLKVSHPISPEKGATQVQDVGKEVQSEGQKANNTEIKSVSKIESANQGKSKVGKRIEANAIESGLATSFSDTARYDKITLKDQAARAAELINTDFERAKRIAMGDEPMPEGLRERALIEGMKKYIDLSGDIQFGLELANSPLVSGTSVHAQELALGRGSNPESTVSLIERAKKIKEAALDKRAEKSKKETVKEIKDSIKKEKKVTATKETWASFIDAITC